MRDPQCKRQGRAKPLLDVGGKGHWPTHPKDAVEEGRGGSETQKFVYQKNGPNQWFIL